MANGLFGLLGRPSGGAQRPGVRPAPRSARPSFPGRPGVAQFGTPGGPGGRTPASFAHGGDVEGAPDVSPDLKLAAYELLECLDSSRYSGSDGKGGRAEAFAKALLAFVHLADAEPHSEGEHTSDEPEPEVDYGDEAE